MNNNKNNNTNPHNKQQHRTRIKIGITHGDINSISYEIILKALNDNRLLDFGIPIVYGSPKVSAYHRKAVNIDNFSFNSIVKAEDANPKKPNLINVLGDEVRVELGKSTTEAGEASLKSLTAAVKDLKEGKIDVLVTAPFNKYNIQSDNFNFPGHTEYLQQEFEAEDALMFMVSDYLKIGVVVGHASMRELPDLITKDKVISKLKIMNKSLISDFGIRKPKIAVLGLNPHAGENGILGKEEEEQILPAINELNEKGMIINGPFSADGFFGAGIFSKFDGILAMYHDQGLIPFKSLVTDGGVNFTAGLKIIRTSPAHGTAYEIAGKDLASADSFRKAIYTACDIFRRRNNLDDLLSNQLKTYDVSAI